ncbi:unnamed protein product [Prorocentrum cordatum]|uniref:Uncharacterized protein n=1 Tax=Prorocentrum cordatum TaxID=2364126 RepID=A0ABN9R608_9DINO|nr:unnamed protein product [Polarella glacialis]
MFLPTSSDRWVLGLIWKSLEDKGEIPKSGARAIPALMQVITTPSQARRLVRSMIIKVDTLPVLAGPTFGILVDKLEMSGTADGDDNIINCYDFDKNKPPDLRWSLVVGLICTKIMGHPRRGIRNAAAETLAAKISYKSRAGIAILGYALNSSHLVPEAVSEAAAGKPLAAAVESSGSGAFPILSRVLSRSEPGVRSKAAGRALFLAIQSMKLEDARVWVAPVMNDTDEEVRTSAGPAHALVAKELAEAAQTRAEQAEQAAEKENEHAREEKVMAEQQREKAENEKAVAVAEKACATALTKQVRMEMSCAGVGDGFMLHGSPAQAYRCRNRGARRPPGVEHEDRQWLGARVGGEAECPLGRSATHPSSPMCCPGYDADSPGCSRCSSGHGRSSTDPFACERCGAPALQLAAFLLVPAALFGMSVRANSQARRSGDTFNDLLKILQSFGSGAADVLSALAACESHASVPGGHEPRGGPNGVSLGQLPS